MRTSESGPKHTHTFESASAEWAAEYVASEEFTTLSESEIMAPIPLVGPRREVKVKLSGKQANHLFRQMNYLRKKAHDMGDQTALAQAWDIRKQLASAFAFVIDWVVDHLKEQYPKQDQARLYDYAVESYLKNLDEFSYQGYPTFHAWAKNKVFTYLASNVIPHQDRFNRMPTVPGWWLSEVSDQEKSEELDADLARTFLDALFEKAEQRRIRQGNKNTSPITIRQIFEPFIADGLGYREIGEAIDLTGARVEQRLKDDLEHMRRAILEDSELLELASQLGIGIEDKEDVRLLLDRMRNKLRSNRKYR